MEKLYYENSYIKEFLAEIEEIIEINDRYHIRLDKTAFFPGGGGQASDLGMIDIHEVKDVYEKEGVVYHVLDKKPIKIHRVKCELNWPKRFDGMQQHTAQHVLSGCFYTLLNLNTCAIHIGEKVSTIDIEGLVSEENLRKVELFANEIISKSLDVNSFVPTKKELKKIKLRRKFPNTNEEIRILQIENLDINACCGVHVKSTMDLRFIKLGKFEKNKNNTRIEYFAGQRAIAQALKDQEFSKKICKYLGASENDAIDKIESMHSKVEDLKSKIIKANEEIAKYEVKEMINNSKTYGDKVIIKNIFENKDLKYVTKLANNLTESNNKIALLALKSDEKINMVFAASKNIKNINIGELLKDTITLIDGKGGGSSYLAQGAGKDNGNLENALEYAISKLI